MAQPSSAAAVARSHAMKTNAARPKDSRKFFARPNPFAGPRRLRVDDRNRSQWRMQMKRTVVRYKDEARDGAGERAPDPAGVSGIAGEIARRRPLSGPEGSATDLHAFQHRRERRRRQPDSAAWRRFGPSKRHQRALHRAAASEARRPSLATIGCLARHETHEGNEHERISGSDPTRQARTFDRLLGELRPKLHRYCARMTGSVIDGEDVVQEALVKAIEAFPKAGLDRRSGGLAVSHRPQCGAGFSAPPRTRRGHHSRRGSGHDRRPRTIPSRDRQIAAASLADLHAACRSRSVAVSSSWTCSATPWRRSAM